MAIFVESCRGATFSYLITRLRQLDFGPSAFSRLAESLWDSSGAQFVIRFPC